jgi:hypothetical protein
MCIAECGGRVCCGCWDGTIAVWDRATLTLERTLPAISVMVRWRSQTAFFLFLGAFSALVGQKSFLLLWR